MPNRLKVIPLKDSWYKEGLQFKCTECGGCCTGSPGYVWISESEMEQIAEYLKISLLEFCQTYTRHVNGRYSLKEHSKTYDCIFLKDKKCKIYPVRPIQCRTFPWWIENLESEESWKEAANRCEGINHPDAPTISYETIRENMTP